MHVCTYTHTDVHVHAHVHAYMHMDKARKTAVGKVGNLLKGLHTLEWLTLNLGHPDS